MNQHKRFYQSMLLVAGLVLSSCATTQINQAALSNLKKVGLVSVTIDKMGQPSANNYEITQRAADYALQQYDQALRAITTFQYVPRKEYQDHPAIKMITNFKSSPVMKTMLKKNEGQALTSAMILKLMGKQDHTNDSMINTFNENYNQQADNKLAAQGCPNIPYQVLKDNPEGSTVHKVSYGNGVEQNKNQLKTYMLESIAYACQKTGLDGMMVIWNKARAYKHVKGVNVVNTKIRRTNGTVRLNATLILVDKTGSIVADMGWPGFDDLSPTKGSLPIMVVKAKDPKKEKMKNLELKDLKTTSLVDLKDPRGDAFRAIKTLIDETSTNLVNQFRKQIGEIK